MSENKLIFPANDYTVETRQVKTSAGVVSVEVRHYDHIVYAANPIDPEYQSMNVDVPVKIDGTEIDVSDAPILLAVRVGGYMQSKCGGKVADMHPPKPGEKPPHPGPQAGRGAPMGMPGAPGMHTKPNNGAPPPRKMDDRILGLALAAGFVLVSPGNRGRGNIDDTGRRFGKAPATIVDLKCVVRYIRANAGRFPGNPEHIITNGLSAGGAMSALLGASGNSPMYADYFAAVGAADARDDVFATAAFCPMCDLEHADMAYEWMVGKYPNHRNGESVDQTLSAALAARFPAYQLSLGLTGHNGELLTADNYGDYLAQEYLIPSANEFLRNMESEERDEYLKSRTWLNWDGESTHFTLPDLNAYAGRLKSVPAFDNPSAGEGQVFGTEQEESVHFSDFGAQLDGEEVREDVRLQTKLMNPMYFLLNGGGDCAKHWWIRLGTTDNGMSFTVAGNLAAALENKGHDVSLKFYWDAGHYTDLDPEDFVEWVCQLTGYQKKEITSC